MKMKLLVSGVIKDICGTPLDVRGSHPISLYSLGHSYNDTHVLRTAAEGGARSGAVVILDATIQRSYLRLRTNISLLTPC